MNITVYLGANEGNDPFFKEAVRELGAWIGTNGNTLVYGGSKSGLMGELAESVLQAGGKVIGVDNRTDTGGGKTVTVEYVRDDGSKTHVQYMHLSQINVQKGDTVNAGQKLGVSGATGTRVTGEHLHLGVINISADNKKTWVNPCSLFGRNQSKRQLEQRSLV